MNERVLVHLDDRERAAIREYLQQLRMVYGSTVLRVVLYGSKVRGDFDAESDIDLFVVLRKPDGDRREHLEKAGFEIGLKYNVILSDLIVDQTRCDWMRQYREPFYEQVEKEGVDLRTTPAEQSSVFDSIGAI